MAAAVARHLNIGISASSIDDVFPGLLEWCEIRQCQTLGEDDALDSDREWIAESKFDGWRCFLTKEGSDVVAYSSGGKRIGWYKEPDRDMFGGTGYICRVVSKMPFDGVLDGEVVGRHWQEAASAGGHAPDSNLVFQAFDLLPYGSSAGFSRRGWWRGLKEVDIPLAARKDALRDLLTGTGQSRPWFSQVSVEDGTRVLYVKHEPVVKPHDPEYVHEIARRHIGQYGYEGVIFKARDSIYTPVRADDWLKFKEQGEAEFMLVDMNEGNGKIAGKLGALIVEDPDTKVQVRVGEGMQYEGGSTLDDEERDRLWRNRASILKDPRYRWVTVVFQKRTSDGSVRHPRFKGFREYRSGGAT
jgi:ATP-dependent DNA ligase